MPKSMSCPKACQVIPKDFLTARAMDPIASRLKLDGINAGVAQVSGATRSSLVRQSVPAERLILVCRRGYAHLAETLSAPNMPPNSSPNLRVAAGKRH